MAKVDIGVAGHTVCVESDDPIEKIADIALLIYEKTRLDAKKIPFGYAPGAPQVEMDPYL